MYCACLLLLLLSSILTIFSDVNAASVHNHKRGLVPTNINIDIQLGKGSASKNAASNAPSDGHKTVLNAPFGLASLTITTNRKDPPTNTKPIDNPEAENIPTKSDVKKPSGTLGGKGDMFFGPPHPPHHDGYGPPPYPHSYPDFGPPPPDFHQSHHHYPPPPPHQHIHYHPHEHHHDCNHEKPFPPFNGNTKVPPIIPGNKPDAKITTTPTPNGKIPQGTTVQSTTDNVDALIGDVFGGSNSASSTTIGTNIDVNGREQTGEGSLDIRMPSSR